MAITMRVVHGNTTVLGTRLRMLCKNLGRTDDIS